MVGDDVLGLVEPKVGHTGEHCAFLTDWRIKNNIKRTEAVRGDNEHALVINIIKFANLAFLD